MCGVGRVGLEGWVVPERLGVVSRMFVCYVVLCLPCFGVLLGRTLGLHLRCCDVQVSEKWTTGALDDDASADHRQRRRPFPGLWGVNWNKPHLP